jgi:hypothetical protein
MEWEHVDLHVFVGAAEYRVEDIEVVDSDGLGK